MLSCGSVRIDNNVEIGALSTIDAGVSATTIIGEGTKIDNQVHIGHDTIVGKNCLMAANVGIAGCVVIKDNVTLWGQVGCASNVTIGKNVIVGAQSGISKSLEEGKTYFGSPCVDVRKKFKEIAAIKAATPKVLLEIVSRAMHLHGSLGSSDETPLATMWANIPELGVVDGPTEVHKVAVAKAVLRHYSAHDALFPSYHTPTQRGKALEKYPDLAEKGGDRS